MMAMKAPPISEATKAMARNSGIRGNDGFAGGSARETMTAVGSE